MTGPQRPAGGALAVLLLVVFVDMAGFGIIIPFMPFWAEHFGATPAVVTLLMASYSFAQFLLAPAIGWASDRWGRKPVLLVSVAGSVLSFAWMGLADALWMLFAARVLAGATSANISVAQAYVADVTPGESRAGGMGLLGAAFGLGFILGPAIGGLLAGGDPAAPDYRTPFLAGAAVSLLSLALGLVLLREPARHRVEAAEGLTPTARLRAFAQVLGHPAVALPIAVMTLLAFVMGGLESTFALWAERQLAWGPRQTGFFLAYIGVCMALVQGGLVGRLSARFGEAPVVALALTVFTAGLVVLPLAQGLGLVLAAGLLTAGGLGLGQPALNSLISRAAPADRQGGVMGASQSAQSLARIFGPAVAGVLFSAFGRNAPYYVGACLTLAALVLALGILRRARD